MKFVADAQKKLIDDLSEKGSMLLHAVNRLESLKEERQWDDVEANIIAVLVQEELFGESPHRVTRRQLGEGLGLGRKKITQGLGSLEETEAVSHKGTRPAFYSLTDKIRARLLAGITGGGDE